MTKSETLHFDEDRGRATKLVCDSGGVTRPHVVKSRRPTVACIPAAEGGVGKVQFSTSLPSEIRAGTAAWRDWPLGVVAAHELTRVDDGLRVTGVRGVSLIGGLTVEVVE